MKLYNPSRFTARIAPKILTAKPLKLTLLLGFRRNSENFENIIVAGGGGGVEWSESQILNSQGINVVQEGGGAYIYFELIGMKEGNVTPGIFDLDAKLSLNLDVEKVVEKCCTESKMDL
ncbi:hypothetical protein J2747_002295 [Thermococcus stetteri]|nr:hypothetical protein [Thermococcus stetteri]